MTFFHKSTGRNGESIPLSSLWKSCQIRSGRYGQHTGISRNGKFWDTWVFRSIVTGHSGLS